MHKGGDVSHDLREGDGQALTRWRTMLAAEKLTSSRDSISEIGFALGYESEKSFSTGVQAGPELLAAPIRSPTYGAERLEGRHSSLTFPGTR